MMQYDPATESAMPSLPGIDTAAGMRRMMNKASLYHKVLRDFSQRFRDEATKIESLLAVSDFETAIRSAHSTKGLAGSIGANELQAAALSLETCIRQGLPDVDIRLEAFALELATVCHGIDTAYEFSG